MKFFSFFVVHDFWKQIGVLDLVCVAPFFVHDMYAVIVVGVLEQPEFPVLRLYVLKLIFVCVHACVFY